MRIPFFGKRTDDSSDEQPVVVQSIVSIDGAQIVPGKAEAALDLSLYDHVTLDAEAIGGSAYVDALIPLAGNIADAAGQWNHALVRFPEGAGWNDLLNRKTPGWEEWKQLGILKDGKFQPQAAIKQAKLQPVAVANLALQGAAIVVGQAYMAEISKQLEGIESGIAAIQQEMKLEREARIEACFEKLCEYLALYGEISENPEKRQAVQVAIEAISTDALEAWKYQVKSMQDLARRVEKGRRMKDDEVKTCLIEFQSRDQEARAAFQLFAAAEQASMQYDNDFSSSRINRERVKMDKCLEEYDNVRSKAQVLLGKRAEEIKGSVLTIPEAQDDGYDSRNPFLDAAHVIKHNAPRFTPLALRKEAKEEASSKRNLYGKAAAARNPIEELCEGKVDELARMDFIYNQADTMMIDEMGIHFIRAQIDESTDDAR